MGIRRRRRRSMKRTPVIVTVGVVAVLGIGTAALTAAALTRPTDPPRARTATWTPSPSAEPVYEQQLAISDVLPRLDDPSREFTIAVFGDSTGVASQGWQVLVPTWLGEQYDRDVTLHPWNRDETSYGQPWGLHTGSGSPVTVWNGSSPGRDVAFAREHEAAIVPIDPASVDIVFMNFGHTEISDWEMVGNVGTFMEDAADKYPNAAIVYLKQNPDHSKSPLLERQRSNVTAMEARAVERNFESIPIYDAFIATGDVDALVDEPTLIHPNDAGYRIWSDRMIEHFTASGARSDS